MLIMRPKSPVQWDETFDERIDEVACYLNDTADLADLSAQITGEMEVETTNLVRQRDHAVAIQCGIIAMVDKAIAELREVARQLKEARNGAGA